MLILYLFFIAYILAVNFYSFLLIKGLKDDYDEECGAGAESDNPKIDVQNAQNRH